MWQKQLENSSRIGLSWLLMKKWKKPANRKEVSLDQVSCKMGKMSVAVVWLACKTLQLKGLQLSLDWDCCSAFFCIHLSLSLPLFPLSWVVQSWVKITQGLVWNLISVLKAFKEKLSIILFVNNLIIGCSKKSKENDPKRALNKEVKKPRSKLNPELVLICPPSTGPRSMKGEPVSYQGHLTGPLDTYSVNIYKHISKVIYYFCIFL